MPFNTSIDGLTIQELLRVIANSRLSGVLTVIDGLRSGRIRRHHMDPRRLHGDRQAVSHSLQEASLLHQRPFPGLGRSRAFDQRRGTSRRGITRAARRPIRADMR